MRTAYIVVDLGFGDAGKGSMVDYLASSRQVAAIVRYTGGPHAAHHVVRPDGVSHAFCQFGATFRPGVRTHLARNMIVKPEDLLYEGWALESKGLASPFAQLSMDPRCRLVTSYHAMLCQMKEDALGTRRRGTVGIGAGEAVMEADENPDQALRVGDLYRPERLREKLLLHFERKQRHTQVILRESAHLPVHEEVRAVYDGFMQQVRLMDVLARYRHFADALPVTICSDEEFMQQAARLPGDLVFEGAHAALLDRDHGYYPYVAKTDTTTRQAVQLLDRSCFDGNVFTLGVVRALGYRHGPGPFVTEDVSLSGLFHERHNRPNEWQGSLRYGWFDLLAIRHGLQLNRPVNALALTMLDHLSRLGSLQVCVSYEYRGSDRERLDEYFEFTSTPSGRVKITGIKPAPTRRTDSLARLLFDCVPWDWLCFDGQKDPVDAFIRFLESADGLGVPVQTVSTGPTVFDKKERHMAELLTYR